MYLIKVGGGEVGGESLVTQFSDRSLWSERQKDQSLQIQVKSFQQLLNKFRLFQQLSVGITLNKMHLGGKTDFKRKKYGGSRGDMHLTRLFLSQCGLICLIK